jgi:hypothetical protein
VSVCLSVCPNFLRKDEAYEIILLSVFLCVCVPNPDFLDVYVVCIVSKESRQSVLLRTSCFFVLCSCNVYWQSDIKLKIQTLLAGK